MLFRSLIDVRRRSHALAHGGIRWIHVGEDSVAYLRESKKESVLVYVSRRGTRTVLDLTPYGYSIDETLFGPELHGKKATIKSKEAVAGIWQLK